jgi:hypothetical protein
MTDFRSRLGPWSAEPDFQTWTYQGLVCVANRNLHFGCWCGYVQVPPDHPLLGQVDRLEELAVHGGVTHVGGGSHFHDQTQVDPRRCWVGWDCAHAGDSIPSLGHWNHEDHYWTLHEVIAETNHLAQQLAEWRSLPTCGEIPC